MVILYNFGGLPMAKKAKKKAQGMKWFHFLIYFVLWLNAAVCVLNAIACFTNNSVPAEIYASYPLMKTMDLFLGAAYLIFAIFCLFTRSRLAKYKKGAPATLILFYILSLLVVLVDVVCVCKGLELDLQASISYMLEMDVLSSIISTVIMILINKVYFGKRKHLFVN